MAAPTSYPSWAYNSTQVASVIVANVAAFNALSGVGTWTTTPYATSTTATSDAGLTATDLRLAQILVEMRINNLQLQDGFKLADDPITVLRPDVVANDSSITS